MNDFTNQSKDKPNEVKAIFTITGPPGTGKTQIVLEVGELLNKKGYIMEWTRDAHILIGRKKV